MLYKIKNYAKSLSFTLWIHEFQSALTVPYSGQSVFIEGYEENKFKF